MAGLILWTRRAVDAPEMRQGLESIRSSAKAVCMIARSKL
ncbi:Uncharacterised protein [Mycobacterium tuberculosis]|nr:Uncharacterised protein [Mycobacterium tuberculosis]